MRDLGSKSDNHVRRAVAVESQVEVICGFRRMTMNVTQKRPRQIWYSLYARLVAILVGVAHSTLGILRQHMHAGFRDIAIGLIEIGIVVLLMVQIFRRRRWARSIYAVLTCVTVAGIFLAVLLSAPSSDLARQLPAFRADTVAVLLLQGVLLLFSVYFLYKEHSRQWFQSSDMADVIQSSSETVGLSPGIPSDNKAESMNDLLHSTALRMTPSAPESSTSPTHQPFGRKIRMVLLAVGLLLITCVLAVFVHIQRKAAVASAIHSALTADITLTRQLVGGQGLYDCDVKTLHAYTQGLRKIDMSRCPREFQVAYLEHLQAWESFTRSRAGEDILGPLIKLFLFKQLPDSPDTSDQKEVREQIVATWNEVERIALSYGVKVPE